MLSTLFQQKLSETAIVVLDFETTGFSPRAGDEIIEIGAVKALGGEIVASFQTLVNPVRPISPGASAVNGITDEMVADAPFIENVMPAFLDFIGDAPLVAHNAEFDLSFLAWKIAELSLPEKSNLVFDTMLLSRVLRPNFYNHKLGSVISQLRIELSADHRAVSDAEATLAVFQKLLEPYLSAGDLTVARALALQGGPSAWPRFSDAQVTPGPETEIEAAIRAAIESGGTIVIGYQSPNGAPPTTREIKPLHLSRRPSRSYVVAHCLLKDARRIFRVDRIVEITET